MLMRDLLSNRDATPRFAEILTKREGRGQGQREERKKNPTEMFMRVLWGDYCVDLFFGDCHQPTARHVPSSGSRTFAFAFVDIASRERHS
jgi:hypothetical protein